MTTIKQNPKAQPAKTVLPNLVANIYCHFVKYEVNEFTKLDGEVIQLDTVIVKNPAGRELILKGQLQPKFKKLAGQLVEGADITAVCRVVNRNVIVATDSRASRRWLPTLVLESLEFDGIDEEPIPAPAPKPTPKKAKVYKEVVQQLEQPQTVEEEDFEEIE